MIDVAVADLGGRGRITGTNAGGPHHTHIRNVLAGKRCKQLLGSSQHAAEAVAHPDGHLRRFGFAVGHDIEVGVERRNPRRPPPWGCSVPPPVRATDPPAAHPPYPGSRCRYSISRARSRGASPSKLRTASSSSCLSTRPLGNGALFAPPRTGMDRPAHASPAAARDLRYVVHAHQLGSPHASGWHTIYQRSARCRGPWQRSIGAPEGQPEGPAGRGHPSDVG